MRYPHLSAPLVLVAHGSPDPRSAATVRDVAAAAGARAAFLEFDTPDPVTVFTRLARAGHRRAVLVPLLLTDAYHSRVDVPRITREAVEATGMDIRVRGTIGGVGLLPALTRDLPRCEAVVLAAAGTRRPQGQAAVHAVAEALGERLGMPSRAAFASAAEPGVAQAVRESVARHGPTAVVSYFIAPGLLHDRVVTEAGEAGAVGVGPVLGAAPELVAAVTGGQSTPMADRLVGITRSTAVPTPISQAPAAYQPSPA